MSLPGLIEILPLTQPVRADVTVPGSKSITNRALILAALAEGTTKLLGALWSEDTQVMVEALQSLGFSVKVEPDPEEICNRTITVKGLGGKIPKAGTAEQPLELFVGNAGTAARFLSAMVCLGNGVYRLSGVPRMHERPQAALFEALRELGYRVDAPNNKLPATFFGRSSRGNEAQTSKSENSQSLLTSAATNERKCTVSIEESSQFASALLLCAKNGGWDVNVIGESAEESPYIAMTSRLIEVFPQGGKTFRIEPDASSGSYFWGAAMLMSIHETGKALEDVESGATLSGNQLLQSQITVQPRCLTEWQIDAQFEKLMQEDFDKISHVSRKNQLGDSIMTIITLAPSVASHPIRFMDLGRLRVQECERVVALRTELTKCGAKVIEEGDTLTVYPSKLHGAEIETYNDHRMAMCFAILGLKVPGIRIQNPACVKKTFPNFFQKLATPPPKGLGAEIWEVRDGKRSRKLEMADLFAD